jgi:hypothetical protein
VHIEFKIKQITEDGRSAWATAEAWPKSDIRPMKGELVLLKSGRMLRVVEVLNGQMTLTVYLVPTYVQVGDQSVEAP